MDFDLSNHHFVVTGGAGRLGSAVVELLLELGGKCSVPCYNRDELESFSRKDHSKVFALPDIDLTSEEITQSFYGKAVSEQGPLWASIHIAGGFGMGKIEDTTLDNFNKQLKMNTVTCFNACRAAVTWMRKSSYEGGRIVNITSRPGIEPRQGKGMSAYTVGKAGVAALTEALAAEVVHEHILINALAPSTIDTPENRESMPGADFDKWPKPEQIARQIAYLVSHENEVTRGALIAVYGES